MYLVGFTIEVNQISCSADPLNSVQMNQLRSNTRNVWIHVLTDVILIGIVEGVHDRWFC